MKHSLNRKRAASCLWAYHDARTQLRYAENAPYPKETRIAEYTDMMREAFKQYQSHKFAK